MHAHVGDVQGARRLVISPDANVIFAGDATTLEAAKPTASLWIYPGTKQDGVFARATATAAAAKDVALDVHQTKQAGPARAVKTGSKKKPLPPDDADFADASEWHVALPKDALDGIADLRLRVNYVGDVARAYIGDRLIDDNFYFGPPWEISLKRFAPEVLEKGLTIKVLPLRKDLPVYLPEDQRPTFDAKGEALELRQVEAAPVYEMPLTALR
jgi:hypothetical protein